VREKQNACILVRLSEFSKNGNRLEDTFLSEQKELSQLMELEQLRKIIEKKETMKVEFKTTPLLNPPKRNRSEIACQLVAFANRNGGHLIFGIKDDGSFEGAKINECMHAKDSSIFYSNCLIRLITQIYRILC